MSVSPPQAFSVDSILAQTRAIRGLIRRTVEAHSDRADVIPPGWNNNLRWHTGHLVLVPRRLTLGLLREDTGLPDDYARWFNRGTSPADWKNEPVPPIGELLPALEGSIDFIAERLRGRESERFPRAFASPAGIDVCTPAEGLLFSQFHDGIHLGLILALVRAMK